MACGGEGASVAVFGCAAGAIGIGDGSGGRTSFAFFGGARSAVFVGGAFAWGAGAGSDGAARIDGAAAFRGAASGSSGWRNGPVAGARAEGSALRVGYRGLTGGFAVVSALTHFSAAWALSALSLRKFAETAFASVLGASAPRRFACAFGALTCSAGA